MTEPSSEKTCQGRLQTLERFGIVDNGSAEPELEAIAQRAAATCNTPMAFVTFVTDDKQWIKAAVGSNLKETDREVSFCTWAVHNAEVFYVEDAAQDERFRDNLLVLQEPRIRYYAGAPIPAPDGFILGTVCVLDHQPRHIQAEHISTLQACAQEVSEVLMRRGGGPVSDLVT